MSRVALLFLLFSGFASDRGSLAADEKKTPPFGPESVTVHCGDTDIRIDGPKIWTLSRIQYKNVMLDIEDSASGTVYRFPGMIDIGSAHINSNEKKLWRDGYRTS